MGVEFDGAKDKSQIYNYIRDAGTKIPEWRTTKVVKSKYKFDEIS